MTVSVCDNGGKVLYWHLSRKGDVRDAVEHSICQDLIPNANKDRLEKSSLIFAVLALRRPEACGFEASLNYRRPCLETNKQTSEKEQKQTNKKRRPRNPLF